MCLGGKTDTGRHEGENAVGGGMHPCFTKSRKTFATGGGVLSGGRGYFLIHGMGLLTADTGWKLAKQP